MVERIKKIMEQKGLSVSSFSDLTGINPTTMSFIVNGRRDKDGKRINQEPSTDVITKILAAFSDINAEWLLLGNGSMRKSDKIVLTAAVEPDLFDKNPINPIQNTVRPEYAKENKVKTSEIVIESTKNKEFTPPIIPVKKIDKIMIFYNDNTFVSFSPEV